MQDRKSKQPNEEKGKKGQLGRPEGKVPILASAKTGLASKDDALVRRLPFDYSGTVKEALDYILKDDVKEEESPFAQSIKTELGADGSVVVVNGRQAKLSDSVEKYFVEKEYELPNGDREKYRLLEIEVSAVQQGGRYFQ